MDWWLGGVELSKSYLSSKENLGSPPSIMGFSWGLFKGFLSYRQWVGFSEFLLLRGFSERKRYFEILQRRVFRLSLRFFVLRIVLTFVSGV